MNIEVGMSNMIRKRPNVLGGIAYMVFLWQGKQI